MISNKDRKFMNRAMEQAKLSPCLMRHGCVAVMNGRIVGKGYNHYRTNSKDGFIHNCMTCHAEIAALRAVHKRAANFKKITIYVCRVDSTNQLQESAPCSHCMDTILILNIKRIVHSIPNGGIVSRVPHECTSTHISLGYKKLII